MDQIVCASLSQTHYYWYEVGMLRVPAGGIMWYVYSRCLFLISKAVSYEDFFPEIIRVGGVKIIP